MTAPGPETAPVPLPDTELSAAHASVTLLERLADKLGGRASVTAVYGEPVIADGVTVIPVAEVGFGFGGGAGREIGSTKTSEGGGGGGGAGARPLGFIEIRDGTATYKPIRDPWADVVLPLAGLVIGSALPKIVRSLRRRGRKWAGTVRQPSVSRTYGHGRRSPRRRRPAARGVSGTA